MEKNLEGYKKKIPSQVKKIFEDEFQKLAPNLPNPTKIITEQILHKTGEQKSKAKKPKFKDDDMEVDQNSFEIFLEPEKDEKIKPPKTGAGEKIDAIEAIGSIPSIEGIEGELFADEEDPNAKKSREGQKSIPKKNDHTKLIDSFMDAVVDEDFAEQDVGMEDLMDFHKGDKDFFDINNGEGDTKDEFTINGEDDDFSVDDESNEKKPKEKEKIDFGMEKLGKEMKNIEL